MSNLYLWLFFVGLFAVANGEISPPKNQKIPPFLKIADGNCDFAFRTYHQIASEETGKNIFFSPVSISTAFAALSLGAKGTTLSQLFSGLGFNQTGLSEREIHKGFHHLLHEINRPESETELSIGNALFTHDQYKLRKKFLKDAKYFYHASVFPTNFENPQEAVKQINDYIEEQTHGKLVDVVKELDSQVVLVLINYIFLSASWQKPFDSKRTEKEDFFVDEQTTVQVPMMKQNGRFLVYHDKELFYKVVALPYKGDACAFFILPDPGKLKLVEAALRKDVVSKWGQLLQEQNIELSIPRFSLSTRYDVQVILRKLGITDVFTGRADLSGINGALNLKVSKALHEASLNVHEAGIKAAAVTVAEVAIESLSPAIIFDRPFFLLTTNNRSNNLIFIGKIVNPVKN